MEVSLSAPNDHEMASMGPASENAGYGLGQAFSSYPQLVLQWVRRPRTPVMYHVYGAATRHRGRFNGSGVRERRLWRPSAKTKTTLAGFNGSGVRERRLCRRPRAGSADPRRTASMGPASENAGYAVDRSIQQSSEPRFNGSGVRERRLWRVPSGL